jgi:hypothetical protein
MFCSYCGAAVAQGLSYCKHCGSKSGGAKGDAPDKASELRPETLVSAMMLVFVFGLGAIIGLMAVMRTLPGFDFGRIMVVTLLSFLILVGLEAVFIWLLLRRRGGFKGADDSTSLKGHTTKELDAAQARALPEPLPSVTEHTTRTLDPVYSERKSK